MPANMNEPDTPLGNKPTRKTRGRAQRFSGLVDGE